MAGPAKVIVCDPCATVNVRLCVAAGAVALLAVRVMLNVPACVGVPVRVAVPEPVPPDVNVTPAGKAPPVTLMVGVGPPDAAMLNVAMATPTVSPGTVVPDVKDGGAMLTGVTITVAEAALVSIAVLVAVTEHA